jgi:acetylxylan esterase
VTARNVSYNATIPAGGSVGIGFQATHTGNTGRPASFTLNGTACTGA